MNKITEQNICTEIDAKMRRGQVGVVVNKIGNRLKRQLLGSHVMCVNENRLVVLETGELIESQYTCDLRVYVLSPPTTLTIELGGSEK